MPKFGVVLILVGWMPLVWRMYAEGVLEGRLWGEVVSLHLWSVFVGGQALMCLGDVLDWIGSQPIWDGIWMSWIGLARSPRCERRQVVLRSVGMAAVHWCAPQQDGSYAVAVTT